MPQAFGVKRKHVAAAILEDRFECAVERGFVDWRGEQVRALHDLVISFGRERKLNGLPCLDCELLERSGFFDRFSHRLNRIQLYALRRGDIRLRRGIPRALAADARGKPAHFEL